MKIEFELHDNHKLILRLLHLKKEKIFLSSGKDKAVPINKLEYIIDTIAKNTIDFDLLASRLIGFAIDSGTEYDFEYDQKFGRNMANPFSKKEKKSEVEKAIDGLMLLGLIEKETIYKDLYSTTGIVLTSEGEEIAKRVVDERRIIIRPPQKNRNKIFIASAFGYQDVDLLFEKEIITACNYHGYEPVRIDFSEPEQTITEAMMNAIIEASCVITDLTYARPSVYFEAGFAHGMGIPLLLTCRKDHYKNTQDDKRVHFDLEQYKISYWSYSKGNNRFYFQNNMKPIDRLKKIVPKRN